jgi:cholest-4-en-3-one 26-monooxygenase
MFHLHAQYETCSSAGMRLDEIDVYDLDVYVKGVPHDAFRLLRTEAPVHFHKEPNGGRGYWAVTRYADVLAVSKDPGTFSSHRGGTNIPDYAPSDLSVMQMMLINMDPPHHAKFRRLTRMGFTPKMVAKVEPLIQRAAAEIVDRVARDGACDFVRSISAELPLIVLCDILGVPQEDRGKIFDWSNRLIGFDDPEFQTSLEDGKRAAAEVWMYAGQLAAQRQASAPDVDLVSALVHAQVEGEKLTEMELASFFLLLSVAGNETTRNLISGGLLTLLEHPEQLSRLRDDPQLLPTAVEEMLRWITPVMHFRRTATRDVELHGQKIREGDKVVLYYVSANRDEEVFPEAHRFDVGRTPNDHLAFGAGEHFCLGATLARLEIRIMFAELLRRLPDLGLSGHARRLRSNFINGWKQIPVRFTPEAL